MRIRFSLTFTLVLLALGAAFFFPTRPSLCSDPAGCIRIQPGDPLSIGIGVMTSGNGKEVSSEMLQSARLVIQNLAPIDGHDLQIQPFYGNCLPDLVNPATIDLSANRQLLLVLGPTCPEDAVEFIDRLSNAGIGLFSPVAFQAAPQPGLLSFTPDPQNLVIQAVRLIRQKGYVHIAVLATPDTASQEAAKSICAEPSLKADCLESPDQTPAMGATYDAWLEVSLDETQPISPLWNMDNEVTPRMVLSFSRPHPLPGESVPAAWISPQVWNQADGYASEFTTAYQTQPDTLSAKIVYDWFSFLRESVSKVSRGHWDGTIDIPRQALQKRVTIGVNPDQPNRFACIQPDSCQEVPLALFTPSGNGTYIPDPLIQ